MERKNNNALGGKTERIFSKFCQKNRVWAYFCSSKISGQPCDFIIRKHTGELALIDVKHCESDIFSFARIEPNQKSAFDYAMSIDNNITCGFALMSSEDAPIMFLPYTKVLELKSKSKRASIKLSECQDIKDIL